MTRLMADAAYRAAQWDQRFAPHVAPINELVDRLRDDAWAPYVAPIHGGVDARIPTLIRDPGPAIQDALGSGFLSIENDDPTAARLNELLNSVSLGAPDYANPRIHLRSLWVGSTSVGHYPGRRQPQMRGEIFSLASVEGVEGNYRPVDAAGPNYYDASGNEGLGFKEGGALGTPSRRRETIRLDDGVHGLKDGLDASWHEHAHLCFGAVLGALCM